MAVSLLSKNTFLFSLLLFAYANSEETKPCQYPMNGVEHKRELLVENIEKPFMLAVDYERDHLYFSYTLNREGNTNFQIRNLDLANNKIYNIGDVDGGFAPAIDRKTNKIYIGGTDGIFEHDPVTKTSKKIGADKTNVWEMFYADKLYYTTFPQEKAFCLDNDAVKPVSRLENVDTELIAFDKNERMYTSNSSGLFVSEKGATESTLVGDYAVNGLTTDKDGVLYFSTPKTINMVDLKTKTVRNMLKSKDIFGLAVDKNGNMLYADKKNIYRLTPTETKC